MKRKIVFIAAALLAACASAAIETSMVARSAGDTVRLWDSPCVHGETLARIGLIVPPQPRDKYRKARAIVGGHDFFGCWVVDGVYVRLVYEDGDQGLIPLTDFKVDEGA